MKKKEELIIKAVLGLYIFYILFSIVDQEIKIRSFKKQISKSEERIKEQEKEAKEIEKQIENSNSEQVIEKEARERLKMIKPNEIIYIDPNKKAYN